VITLRGPQAVKRYQRASAAVMGVEQSNKVFEDERRTNAEAFLRIERMGLRVSSLRPATCELSRKLAGAGLCELTRMPHALDPEKGFRVRSTFIFEDFIGTAQPPSPLRWLADIFLPLVAHAM